MRPPNYTLLMIWVPVIILATIVGYLKRENLHVLYNTRYWAVAAMVRAAREFIYSQTSLKGYSEISTPLYTKDTLLCPKYAFLIEIYP